MTQVIIKTETAEEMGKVLAMARKSKVNFEAVTIKKKTPAIGKSKKLNSDDWSFANRPATPTERQEHAELISKQRGGITFDELDKTMIPWIKGF